VRTAIFAAFKEAGIEIPFPQRDVHVKSVAPASATEV
jgi:small-conductance mechanosensitive channel